jgi:rod shape-determining protein MreB
MLARQKMRRWIGLSAPGVKSLQPMAYGDKAKEMLNREPKSVEVISPVKNGVILDMEAAEELISYYLRLVYEIPSRYPKIFKPKVIVGVPSWVNQVQKRAVKSIFLVSGAGEVMLVEEAALSAVGLGLPVDRSAGLLIVDVGGGKTEAAIVSMGGVVVGKGIKTAGDNLDEAIMNYLKMKYGLLVGKNSAERIKMEIGNVGEGSGREVLAKGRDLETGLPRGIKVNESEIREAIILEASKIVKLVREVLDEAPPELMDEVMKRGITLVGNGSKLKGLGELIEKDTRINVRVAEEPGLSVVRGGEELIRKREILKQIKLVSGFKQ